MIIPCNNIQHFYFSSLKIFDMVGGRIANCWIEKWTNTKNIEKHLDNRFLLDSITPNEIPEEIKAIHVNKDTLLGVKQLVESIKEDNTWNV